MRTNLVLAVLLAVGGIGGTGHAAPMARMADSAPRTVLYAYAVDTGGLATPLGPCAALAAQDRAGCRRLEVSITDARRTLAYADLARDWDGARRAAFARLVAAQESYARAIGAQETDAGNRADAERAEKDAFLKTLRAVLRGLPAPHAESFESDDAELNVAYAHVMETRGDWGGVDKAGVRRAERAWIGYRDAFIAFAATLAAPGAGDAVKAELTRRRTADLETMLAD